MLRRQLFLCRLLLHEAFDHVVGLRLVRVQPVLRVRRRAAVLPQPVHRLAEAPEVHAHLKPANIFSFGRCKFLKDAGPYKEGEEMYHIIVYMNSSEICIFKEKDDLFETLKGTVIPVRNIY